jgi:Concanavalin A-like lectin/glucanases superfamily
MKKLNQIGIVLLLSILISCEKSEEKTIIQNLNCLSTGLQNGVIALYSFGNGSLNDTSGNNYNLINTTTASSGIDRAGNPNCAFKFNSANNEFLKYTNPTFLDNLPINNLSISFWYKSNNQTYGAFISRDNQQYCGSSFGEWSIGHTNNVLIFGLQNGRLLHYGVETTNWEHIVITSNNSNNQLFVNGVLTTNGSGINGTSCPILNQGDLFIGRLYDGFIDDIIIYNRIITSTEVTELSNLNACCN